MKGIIRGVIFISACLISLNSVLAGSSVIFSSPEAQMEIGGNVLLLEDPSGTLPLSVVRSSRQFVASTQKVPNLGISSYTHWIKIEVTNNTSFSQLLLELAYPTIDFIEFFDPQSDGSYTTVNMGETFSFMERKYKHQNFIFDLHVPQYQTRTFFLRVRSGEQIQLPLNLGTPQAIFEANVVEDLISGIYFGIILVMLFYNLFLYFTIRDLSYLYYVFYILFVGLTQACLQGYTFRYLWPYLPQLAIHSTYLIPICSGLAVGLFVRHFLQTPRYAPQLDKGITLFMGLYLICMVIGGLGYFNVCNQLTQITAMVGSVYILYIGYVISRKNYRPAKIFLLAWTIFLAGVCVFVLKNFDILPYNFFTYYILQIGSAIEVVLLSFALADRINILKKEKEESQLKALEALQENERIIKEQNIILDTKVRERTLELQESNRELSITLKRLKETQSQLVNSEKMASLGQLTAGIAHEINNPINFVSAGMKPLKRNIGYFLTVMDKYDQIISRTECKNSFTEVESLKKKYDLDYCKEEITAILQGIEEGASRTTEIVKGLRNFSRLDEAELKVASLNVGLDSTIILLQGRISGRINIVKEYSDIPEIECYAGKLNQVFMNILTNAIQAVQAKALRPGEGYIKIQTLHNDDEVIVRFKDNGVGMSEEVKRRIFEPFFTTKEVGEGTGLGMSIVYSIMEMHKGKILVQSQEGAGTEISLVIPKVAVPAV